MRTNRYISADPVALMFALVRTIARRARADLGWFVRGILLSIALIATLHTLGATTALDNAWNTRLYDLLGAATEHRDAPLFVPLDRATFEQIGHFPLADWELVDLHERLFAASPKRVLVSPRISAPLRRAGELWPTTLTDAESSGQLVLCAGDRVDPSAPIDPAIADVRRCIATAIGRPDSAEVNALGSAHEAPSISAAHILSARADRTWFEGQTIFVGEDLREDGTPGADRQTARWLATISRGLGLRPLPSWLGWMLALLLAFTTLWLIRARSTVRTLTWLGGLELVILGACILALSSYSILAPAGLLSMSLLSAGLVGFLLERHGVERRLVALARPASTLAETCTDTTVLVGGIGPFIDHLVAQFGVPASATVLFSAQGGPELEHIVTTGDASIRHDVLLSTIAEQSVATPTWFSGLIPDTPELHCFVIPLNTDVRRHGYWVLCIRSEEMQAASKRLFITLGRIVCAQVRSLGVPGDAQLEASSTAEGPLLGVQRIRSALRTARRNAFAVHRTYQRQPFALLEADASGLIAHSNIAGRRLLHTAKLYETELPSLTKLLSRLAGLDEKGAQATLTRLIQGGQETRFHCCLDPAEQSASTYDCVLAWTPPSPDLTDDDGLPGGSFTLSAIRRSSSNAVALSTEPSDIDLRPLLTSSIEWARERSPKGIGRTFEISFQDPLPRVWAHYNALAHALRILFLDVLANGGGEAPCHVRVFPQGSSVLIRIVDPASTIPEVALPALFVSPAERVNDSRAQNHLAQAKQLISENDGTLRVESVPGSGIAYTAEFERTIAPKPYRSYSPPGA